MAKSQRGFAGMDPAEQREIARAGGRAAHRSGHAHEFTPEEAAAAGRKGGRARHRKNADASQETGVPRQTEKMPESGDMENADRQFNMAETRSEAVARLNPQADTRDLDEEQRPEAFEGDGQMMRARDEASGNRQSDMDADPSRTSAARRGPDSENEDED